MMCETLAVHLRRSNILVGTWDKGAAATCAGHSVLMGLLDLVIRQRVAFLPHSGQCRFNDDDKE